MNRRSKFNNYLLLDVARYQIVDGISYFGCRFEYNSGKPKVVGVNYRFQYFPARSLLVAIPAKSHVELVSISVIPPFVVSKVSVRPSIWREKTATDPAVWWVFVVSLNAENVTLSKNASPCFDPSFLFRRRRSTLPLPQWLKIQQVDRPMMLFSERF
jgi:hypothetical protein